MVLVKYAYEMDFCVYINVNMPDKGAKGLTYL